MKKISNNLTRFVAGLLFIILPSPFFADSKNIVYSQSFDFTQLDSIEVTLNWENLVISQIYGDEISVEVGCNNLNKIPTVSQKDGIFSIQSKPQKVSKGDRCTVYLYLPQDFMPQTVKINSSSGNIQADILRAQNTVAVANVSGRTDIASCTTEFYNVTTVSGNATLQKINSDYFDFSSTSGKIFAELTTAPLASSGITTISGRSQLYVPKGASLNFAVFSISGSINNSITTPSSSTAPKVTISSVSGKIEIKEY